MPPADLQDDPGGTGGPLSACAPESLPLLASSLSSMRSVVDACKFLASLHSQIDSGAAAPAEEAPKAAIEAERSSSHCCWWLYRPRPDATSASTVAATDAAMVASWALQQLLMKLSKHKGDVQTQDALLLAALLCCLPQRLSSQHLPVVLNVSSRVLGQLRQKQQQQQQQTENNCCSCCMQCRCCRLRQLLGLTSAGADFVGSPSLPCVELALQLASNAAEELLATAAAQSSDQPVCCCPSQSSSSGSCGLALLRAVCAGSFRVFSRLLKTQPDSAQRHVISMMCLGRQQQQKPTQQQGKQQPAQKQMLQPSPLQMLFGVLGLVGLLRRIPAIAHFSGWKQQQSSGSSSSVDWLHQEATELVERLLGLSTRASLFAELQQQQQQIGQVLDTMAAASEAREHSQLQSLQLNGSFKEQQQQQQHEQQRLVQQQPLQMLVAPHKGENAAHRLLFAALAALAKQQRQVFQGQVTSSDPQSCLLAMLPGLGLLDALPQITVLLLDGLCDASADGPAEAAAEEAENAVAAAPAEIRDVKGEAAASHVAALDAFLLLLHIVEPLIDLSVTAFPLTSYMEQQQQQKQQQQQQQFLWTENIRWGAVVSSWHRVCCSSLFSPRLLEQRRHQASLSAFACRCIAALHATLQQLHAFLGLPGPSWTRDLDVFECVYRVANPLQEPLMLPLCLLLRTLWGGASFQLQMMPTGFEGLLHHVLKLQELQHVLLHAATTNNNPQQTLATCFAPQVPPEIDVVQRAGSMEFLQLLGCTYTRMNDVPALLAALGEHLGMTEPWRSSAEAAAASSKAVSDVQRGMGALTGGHSTPRELQLPRWFPSIFLSSTHKSTAMVFILLHLHTLALLYLYAEGSLAFGLRLGFLEIISSAASAALASQVPQMLQRLQQQLLQSTTALLRATQPQQQRQQHKGVEKLVINAVAVQLMMSSFLSGVQQQPQQQQELLLLHLLDAVPDAIASVIELQPLQQQRLQLLATEGTAHQLQHQLLLGLLKRGRESLHLSVCLLLRHVRSFGVPSSVAVRLLPAAISATDNWAGLPQLPRTTELSAAIRSVAQSTRALQRMQEQRQPVSAASDDTADADEQQQALFLLHQQQLLLQLQQSRSLQRLEYLLLLNLLHEGRQGQRQLKKRKKLNYLQDSAGLKAAKLMLLLQQEMGVPSSSGAVMCQVLVQLHNACHCTEVDNAPAAASVAQARSLLPHLPSLFRVLSPLATAAATKESPPCCESCGATIASCVLSSIAGLCLSDPLPAASAEAKAAAAAAAAVDATPNTVAAAAAAASKQARRVIGDWVLSSDLLEEQAAYPLLMQRIATLLSRAAAAASAIESAAETPSAACEEASAPKTQRTINSRRQPRGNEEEAAPLRNGEVAAVAALQELSLVLSEQLPAEFFASCNADDSLRVAVALWEALQATTQGIQEPSVHPEQCQLRCAAAAALCRTLRHVCSSRDGETAERWAVACIAQGRGLRAVFMPLIWCTTTVGSSNYSQAVADSMVAAAEAVADVLWAATRAVAAAGTGSAAAVGAAADLLLLGDEDTEEEMQQRRRKLQKRMRWALKQGDSLAAIGCCSAAAKAFAARSRQTVSSPEAEAESCVRLLLPLAAFKALHALAVPWIESHAQQRCRQQEEEGKSQQQQQQPLNQALESLLPSNQTRSSLAMLAATVAAALDEQLTTYWLLSSPAAAAAKRSPMLGYLVAGVNDLLRQHQILVASLLQHRANAAAATELKAMAVKEDREESGQQQQQQHQQQRERMQLGRRELDKISAVVVSRCSARTPEPTHVPMNVTDPVAQPQQILRLLRKLQGLLLSLQLPNTASEGCCRLRGSCMRLLLLLCLHWSGTMKQVALRPEQQQGEQEQEQKQQAAADGLQPNASAADDYELCKFLTARLAGLLLQVTRRELQLYVGSAVFGAVASSVAGGSQQRLKERGMQTESSKHQWQQSLELQHLLAVVLQQEQQKESVEISALFFLADTCWATLITGLPVFLLTHTIAELVRILQGSLEAFRQEQLQPGHAEQSMQLEDAAMTAAASAQALWVIAVQRSELTRCLRREDGSHPLHQTLLAATQLLLQLLQVASARTKRFYICIGDGLLRGCSHQSSRQQQQSKEVQNSVMKIMCLHAWCCARTAQFSAELFRCSALVAAGKRADKQSRKTQVQLEAVADVMLEAARMLIEQVENNDAAKQQSHTQMQEGPLACIRGRAAVRGFSVLLTTLWKSHEFIPQQRQQQALLISLLRLLRLLPRLQHRRTLEDSMDALRRTGACMANHSSSSRRLLIFFAAEVAHLRQQVVHGAAVTTAAQRGSPASTGDTRKFIDTNLLSLVFEEMAGAAAADEEGELVGEVACHYRDPARSALQSVFDEFCQNHLYKGNA